MFMLFIHTKYAIIAYTLYKTYLMQIWSSLLNSGHMSDSTMIVLFQIFCEHVNAWGER